MKDNMNNRTADTAAAQNGHPGLAHAAPSQSAGVTDDRSVIHRGALIQINPRNQP